MFYKRDFKCGDCRQWLQRCNAMLKHLVLSKFTLNVLTCIWDAFFRSKETCYRSNISQNLKFDYSTTKNLQCFYLLHLPYNPLLNITLAQFTLFRSLIFSKDYHLTFSGLQGRFVALFSQGHEF